MISKTHLFSHFYTLSRYLMSKELSLVSLHSKLNVFCSLFHSIEKTIDSFTGILSLRNVTQYDKYSFSKNEITWTTGHFTVYVLLFTKISFNKPKHTIWSSTTSNIQCYAVSFFAYIVTKHMHQIFINVYTCTNHIIICIHCIYIYTVYP